MRNEACQQFRLMMFNVIDKDVFFCAHHHLNCSPCLSWVGTVYYPIFKGGMFGGVDQFGTGSRG